MGSLNQTSQSALYPAASLIANCLLHKTSCRTDTRWSDPSPITPPSHFPTNQPSLPPLPLLSWALVAAFLHTLTSEGPLLPPVLIDAAFAAFSVIFLEPFRVCVFPHYHESETDRRGELSGRKKSSERPG